MECVEVLELEMKSERMHYEKMARTADNLVQFRILIIHIARLQIEN